MQQRTERYMARARRALRTGEMALEDGDYTATVNRAYYAIFYAANALLVTKGLERSKHSAVIAAFRQHFIKTRTIEVEYSDFYGAVMDDRHKGDYDESEILDYEVARRDMDRAIRFVDCVEEQLKSREALG